MAFIKEDVIINQVTTTIGQVILFFTFLINILFQWKQQTRQRKWQIEDKNALQQKSEEVGQKVVQQTKEALDKQTEELKKAARTRVVDLGVQLDNLLTEDRRKRRQDD